MTAAGERPVCGFVGWGPESAALLDALRGTDPERAPHAVALAGAGAPAEVARTVPSVEALFASAQLIVAEGGAAALEPHLATIRLAISDRHVLVLLGSGWSLEPLLTHLHERKLVRCLLLPAQSGTAGSLAFHPTPYFTASELAAFKATFAHLELCVELRDERHFELVQGLADFAPAVFYTVLEAMGDSMVMMGFSRDAAVNLVASLLHGTAQRVLDAGGTTGALREQALVSEVAAAGLVELESAGIRGTVMRAVQRAVRRSGAQEAPLRSGEEEY